MSQDTITDMDIEAARIRQIALEQWEKCEKAREADREIKKMWREIEKPRQERGGKGGKS